MDFSHLFRSRGTSSRTSKRIQTLSQRLVPKFRLKIPSLPFYQTYKDHLHGFGFFFGALLCGYLANQASEKDAVSKWERSNLPPLKIVDFALASFQLNELRESSQLSRVLRSLPMTLDESASLWTSPEPNWVAYFPHSEEALQPKIYCWECTQAPPQNWQPMGWGWRALERTVDFLAQHPPKPKPNPVSQIRPNPAQPPLFIDPRALQY